MWQMTPLPEIFYEAAPGTEHPALWKPSEMRCAVQERAFDLLTNKLTHPLQSQHLTM